MDTIVQYGSKKVLAAMVLLVVICYTTGRAQIIRDSVPELMDVDIVEQLGERVPFDLTFVDDGGNSVTLGDYFGKEKPVLLTLGYFECPMLCNLVFNGLSDGVRDLGWVPGEDYEMVTVSIDHLETYDLAKAKKENYINYLGMTGAENGWHFLVGEKSQSEALAEAVGFKYYYVEERDEYAHPAAAYLISPDGVISRYLYGIKFSARDLKLGLMEAAEGKIGTTVDRIILYCFHYDPEAKGYVLFARNVMKLGGLVTLVLLGSLLGGLWLRERLKMRTALPNNGNHTANSNAGMN